MKKVLSIILAVFCFSLTVTYADNNNDGDKKSSKPIKIIKGKLTVGIERTAQYVDAVLNTDTYTVDVDFYGLGEGEIYILDSSHAVVDSMPVIFETDHVVLSSPVAEGCYVLIVSCSNYYGEGYFTID